MSEEIKKHKHSIYDTDPHFKIDPISMAITTEAKKLALMKGDHNCERFTFEMPKEIEGHDMLLCDKVEIHYINIESGGPGRVEDIHEVEDFQVSPASEEVLIFSWELDGNATKYPGTLAFAIVFKCTDGDINTYQKSTDKFSGITVKDTINNSNAVVEEHSDILQQWYDKLVDASTGDEETIKVDSIKLESDAWVNSEDGVYFTQVVAISDITENTKIDLNPTPEQLISIIDSGISMFVTNDNCVVTVYSIGEKPTEDMVIAVTKQEVVYV